MLRIWFHENCRIYHDRLINDEDRRWFVELLIEKIRAEFEEDPEEILGHERLLFADFLNPNIDPRPYIQITDIDEVSQLIVKTLI